MPKVILVYISLLLTTFAYSATEQNFQGWYQILKESPNRKQSFVNMLLPFINEQNQKILDDREFVISFFEKYPNPKSDAKIDLADYQRLVDIASSYKISDVFNKEEYLNKVDTIPASLVLSQAALESGWGSSRLSKASNNLFGQKSFGSSNYIKAKESSKVKYAVFETIGDAVSAYMSNLNSHPAYKEFRKKRADTRRKNLEFTGLKAAKTLINYSEVKGYTRALSQLINSYFKIYDNTKNVITKEALTAGFTH